MTRRALSLNPRPDHALEHKEAEAERLASVDPPRHLRVVAGIDALAAEHGLEDAHKGIRHWVRNNPQLARNDRAKAVQAGEKLFANLKSGGAE